VEFNDYLKRVVERGAVKVRAMTDPCGLITLKVILPHELGVDNGHAEGV
jgi:hypothetical protein